MEYNNCNCETSTYTKCFITTSHFVNSWHLGEQCILSRLPLFRKFFYFPFMEYDNCNCETSTYTKCFITTSFSSFFFVLVLFFSSSRDSCRSYFIFLSWNMTTVTTVKLVYKVLHNNQAFRAFFLCSIFQFLQRYLRVVLQLWMPIKRPLLMGKLLSRGSQ